MDLKKLGVAAAILGGLVFVVFAQVPPACTGITFDRNLKLGSRGADVKCLQALLNQSADTEVAATGPGSPGNETTYFGPLTRAAVIKFQEKYADEILAPLGLTKGTGFVGAKTRAKLNALLGAGVPAPTPTPAAGAEGIIDVSKNPSPASGQAFYEGDTGKAVLGILVKAKNSDITVQRVTVNFGSDRPYDYLSKLYVYEGDTQLAVVDLNSNTVYKSGGKYYVTISGLNVRVPKDGSKVLTLKVDVLSAISRDVTLPKTLTVQVDQNGVRGVDEAGVSQYGPTGGPFYNNFQVKASLASQATLTVSKSGASPKPRNVISGPLGQLSQVEVLRFTIKAQYDDVKVTDILNLSAPMGGSATATTAYLYVEGQADPIAVATVGADIDFDDIAGGAGVVIAKDTTKTFIVKLDYTGVGTTVSTSSVSVTGSATNILAENSKGATVSNVSGSAASDLVYLYSVGPTLALSSATISKITNGTTSAEAKIVFTMTAEGGDVTLEKSGAISAVYATSSAANGTTQGVAVAYSASGFTSEDANSWTISEGTTATITVDVKVRSDLLPAAYLNRYGYVTLTGITWNTNKTTSWVADLYKTGTVYLP